MNTPKKTSAAPKVLAGCGCLFLCVLLACGGTGVFLYRSGALQEFFTAAQAAAGDVIAIQSEMLSQHGIRADQMQISFPLKNGKMSLRMELKDTSYATLPEADREEKALEIARLADSKLSNTLNVAEICIILVEGSGSSGTEHEHCFDRSAL